MHGAAARDAWRRNRWSGIIATLCVLLALSPLSADARDPEQAPRGLVLKGLTVVQQTTDYTCGPAAAIGVARYLGVDADELLVAKDMGTSPKVGTNPQQMAGWFIRQGFRVRWGEHGTIAQLKENLAKGIPTLVEWIDWGGHWVVVVGIDDKGTPDPDDDDILFADPWDRVDGIPDGFTRFNLERFDSMWFDAHLFHRPMRRVFVTVEK